MENKLVLLGISKHINSCVIEMYFTNGEVKDCYESDFGFKINDNVSEPTVTVNGYKDKQEWNGTEHIIVGKDEKQIQTCIIEANRNTIENYMFKLGIFSETVDVNRQIIEDKLQSDLESTISMLSSSISMLEHEISEFAKIKQIN